MKCVDCGNVVEDPEEMNICNDCYSQYWESQPDEGCAHCGDTQSELDSDNLCEVCARAQYLFDNGQCPVCEVPSAGSRTCTGC